MSAWPRRAGGRRSRQILPQRCRRLPAASAWPMSLVHADPCDSAYDDPRHGSGDAGRGASGRADARHGGAARRRIDHALREPNSGRGNHGLAPPGRRRMPSPSARPAARRASPWSPFSNRIRDAAFRFPRPPHPSSPRNFPPEPTCHPWPRVARAPWTVVGAGRGGAESGVPTPGRRLAVAVRRAADVRPHRASGCACGSR